MSKFSIVAIIAASVGFTGVGQSVANGGMGDPSAHMKEIEKICEAQRRGELPRDPSYCWPEYPDKSVRR